MSEKLLIVGYYNDPHFMKESKALSAMSMLSIAATGRDMVGDCIDGLGTVKAKEPNEAKQGAAQAKRLRRAERNKRNAQLASK